MRAEFVEIQGRSPIRACFFTYRQGLTIILKKYWPDLQVSFRSALNKAVEERYCYTGILIALWWIESLLPQGM